MSDPALHAWLLAVAVVLVPGRGSSGDGIAFQDLRIDDVDGGLGNRAVVDPSATVHSSGIDLGPSMPLAAPASVPVEARSASRPRSRRTVVAHRMLIDGMLLAGTFGSTLLCAGSA